MAESSVGYYDCGDLLRVNPADPYALQIQALYHRIDELIHTIDLMRIEMENFMNESRE